MRLNNETPISFQENLVPSRTRLIGWAALVLTFSIQVPVRRPSCVSEKHVRGSHKKEDGWVVFDKRYWSGDDFGNHLTFAFRHEDIDLLIMKRVFDAVPKSVIKDFIRATPTGALARRAWFLYEFLTKHTLDLPDATGDLTAVDLLHSDAYFTGKPTLSKRHRVRDNLLGTGDFCPIIRRTKVLEEFINLKLSEKAKEIVAKSDSRLIARAASFMLLADSRASFEIEGERPPRNRLERWGRAVSQAGKNALSLEEIVRLHGVSDRGYALYSCRPAPRRCVFGGA